MKCNDGVGMDDLRRSNGNGGRGIGRRMREGQTGMVGGGR